MLNLSRFNIIFVRQGVKQTYAQVYTTRTADEIKQRFSDLIGHRAQKVIVEPAIIIDEDVLLDKDLFE